MKQYKLILSLCLFMMAVHACTEDKIGPVGDYGGAPSPVSNAEVLNMPGAAKISYSLPKDPDILYVKAEFTAQDGKLRRVKASYYANSLLVEGFAKAGSYEVMLYAVDRGENTSAPLKVTVSPSKPPVMSVFESLKMQEDFGGVNVEFENATRAQLSLVVCSTDSAGDLVPFETFYTERAEGKFSVRGFAAKKRRFAVYVRDRWNNMSDTLQAELVPIFEQQLDKKQFKPLLLPTDTDFAWGLPLKNLFDDNVSSGNMFHTAQGGGLPQWYSFDMGVTAKVSRFKVFQRPDNCLYSHGNPRKYEIWGIATTPPLNGSWDGWVKLGTYESIKPSGLPLGQLSQEDVEYAMRGEEYEVPLSAPPVRYIRFKLLRNWTDTDFIHIREMTFWGQVQ